jgi:hypothetical protein
MLFENLNSYFRKTDIFGNNFVSILITKFLKYNDWMNISVIPSLYLYWISRIDILISVQSKRNKSSVRAFSDSFFCSVKFIKTNFKIQFQYFSTLKCSFLNTIQKSI